MAILRTQEEISGASMDDLLETYYEMTGNAVKRFASRAIAETRVTMALLSAKNDAGMAGVPKGVPVVAKTKAEIEIKKVTWPGKVASLPKLENPLASEFSPEDGCEEAENPYQPGTMSAQLWVACRDAKKIIPKEKRAKSARANRANLQSIYATFAGTSVLQASSTRSLVLLFIQAIKERPVTLEEIDVYLVSISAKGSARGYVQKLIEKHHVAVSE